MVHWWFAGENREQRRACLNIDTGLLEISDFLLMVHWRLATGSWEENGEGIFFGRLCATVTIKSLCATVEIKMS